MRKFILFIACLACICSNSLAQQRPKVYVAPFKSSHKDIRDIMSSFKAAVINGIAHSDRTLIIDGENLQNPNTSVLESARNSGADYIFQCELKVDNISNVLNLLQTLDNATNNKTGAISEQISYSIELSRVSDGVMIHSSRFNSTSTASTSSYSSSLAPISSANQAHVRATNDALRWVSQQMMYYFESIFPLNANIVEVAEVKRNKLKKVYINLGSLSPVHRGIFFDVFVEKIIAGEVVKDRIGQLRVDEVKGEKISLCTVNRGAEKIKDELNEGTELKLISVVR